MPWSSPHTFLVGEVPTAAVLNTTWHDNTLSLRGLNDSGVKVYRTTAWPIAHDTRVVIPWQAAVWQVGTPWALTPNPTRLTALLAGYYLLTITLDWTASGNGGRRGTGFKVNGGSTSYDLQHQLSGSSAERPNGADMILLNAGDYVEFYGYQTSGSTLSLLGTGEGDCAATFSMQGS